MNYHLFGKTLGMLRKQQGITQEKLCDGIIEPDAMSKIERGVHGVSKEKMDLLLGRLGHVAKRFFPYPLTTDELTVFNIRDEFSRLDENADLDKKKELVEAMEDPQGLFSTGLHRQFLLKCKAMILMKENGDADDIKALLDDAVRITLPNFNERLVSTYLLGNDDMEIIAMMAQLAYREGEKDSAITLLTKLVESIEKHYVDENEKARSLTFVMYSLSRYLGLMERYSEGLLVCEKAIEAGVKNRAYGFLPLLKYNQAYCLYYLGEREPGEVAMLVNEAYYACKVHGKHTLSINIKRHAKEMFYVDVAG